MTSTANAAAPKKDEAKVLIERFNELCGQAIEKSFLASNATSMSQSFLFANELTAWNRILSGAREQQLYSAAEQEYLISLLNLSQGQYRNAFKALRLVMELCLQGVYLSANLVLLDEWLRRDADTFWATIVHSENGIYSSRFCKSFFPEITNHIKNFSGMAQTIYREFSECIHGNVPFHIPIPTAIEFDAASFKIWHEKAATVRLIVHFTLSMRYLKSLSVDAQSKLEPQILDILGHIEAIRKTFGGT